MESYETTRFTQKEVLLLCQQMLHEKKVLNLSGSFFF